MCLRCDPMEVGPRGDGSPTLIASAASVYCGPPLQRGSGGASPLPWSLLVANPRGESAARTVATPARGSGGREPPGRAKRLPTAARPPTVKPSDKTLLRESAPLRKSEQPHDVPRPVCGIHQRQVPALDDRDGLRLALERSARDADSDDAVGD